VISFSYPFGSGQCGELEQRSFVASNSAPTVMLRCPAYRAAVEFHARVPGLHFRLDLAHGRLVLRAQLRLVFGELTVSFSLARRWTSHSRPNFSVAERTVPYTWRLISAVLTLFGCAFIAENDCCGDRCRRRTSQASAPVRGRGPWTPGRGRKWRAVNLIFITRSPLMWDGLLRNLSDGPAHRRA